MIRLNYIFTEIILALFGGYTIIIPEILSWNDMCII